MLDKVKKTVDEYKMLVGKNKVIVALSGGADSMCLLDVMLELSHNYPITVIAAHVNHCLRGEESQRDNLFVREECNKRGVTLFEKSIDIKSLARTRKQGLEECGRIERYAFFASLADDDNTVIATAHTASDNAETVLLNMTRGCGVEGLSGIPPVRDNIIRPLIRCTRREIEKYCSDRDIPFVIDSTNLTDDYARNIIRHNVLPQLKKINSSADSVINRLSDLAKTESRYINKQSRFILEKNSVDGGYSVSGLLSEDEDILPSVIKLAVEKIFHITAEKRHIDIIVEMIQNRFGALQIRKNCIVKIKGDTLVFANEEEEEVYFEPVCPKINEVYSFCGKKYVFREKKSENDFTDNKINKKLLYLRLKCDILSCDTVLRQRRVGDYFRQYGRNCTKAVKKLFIDEKIPQERRNKLLLLASGKEVLWIEGIGSAENAVPDSDSYIIVEVWEE